MRSHARFFILAPVGIIATIIFVPSISRAVTTQLQPILNYAPALLYNGLSWENPSTNISTVIKDGGTYTMPLGVAGYTLVGAENSNLYGDIRGDLYYLSATSSSRTMIASMHSYMITPISWKRAGTYELKLYGDTYVVSQAPWWRRPIALLIGEPVYAADYWYAPTLLATIHFTVRDTNNLCATPGSCADNVLFIPGIEGSRLYYRGALNIEHQVWEP
ncbi:MAG TPA: hypothetical protein ENI56_01125, partial [Candidatus Kaiserbacteria bacterium]|nr:hypothetical protein [Candidatus Kaiserbacteria bacterium]